MAEAAQNRESGQTSAEDQTRNNVQVGWWLMSIALLIFIMVMVGGITRLTDSGLSITEWKPLMGAIPPLSEAAWLEAFDKYKQIPEYILVNAGMSLAEFKFIYFWEWFHRLLGRFIGVAFAVPLVYFLVTRKIEREMIPRLVLLFVLGGAQGALGWYMVMSGLVDRVDVSQYRLTAHLGFAVLLFVFSLWVAFGLLVPKEKLEQAATGSMATHALGFTTLVFAQILLGGFVAGLDAGIGYNTWPLMDGAFIPSGLYAESTFVASMFENTMSVQFNHRMVAYLVVVMAGVLFVLSGKVPLSARQKKILNLLCVSVLAQVALGIFTLIYFVPLWLGVLHQGGALIVLGLGLYYGYLLKSADPA
jgi:cytochrome c oxidase assembly protein subunit 15